MAGMDRPHTEQESEQPALISMAGIWLGVRRASVLLPGIVVLYVAFGAAAAAKGLSLAEALL